MRTTIRLATLILLCTAPWPALAFEKNVLTVWIGQDKGFNGLAEIGQRFTADSRWANLLAVDALNLMQQRHITALLVADGDQLLGVVHMHDMLRAGVV